MVCARDGPSGAPAAPPGLAGRSRNAMTAQRDDDVWRSRPTGGHVAKGPNLSPIRTPLATVSHRRSSLPCDRRLVPRDPGAWNATKSSTPGASTTTSSHPCPHGFPIPARPHFPPFPGTDAPRFEERGRRPRARWSWRGRKPKSIGRSGVRPRDVARDGLSFPPGGTLCFPIVPPPVTDRPSRSCRPTPLPPPAPPNVVAVAR